MHLFFVRLKVTNSISTQNDPTFIKEPVAKLTYFLRMHTIYKHRKDSVSFGLDVPMKEARGNHEDYCRSAVERRVKD